MDVELVELEKEFRDSWRNYDPARYSAYLSRTGDNNRVELLARLLGVELEYSFQPPIPVDENPTARASDDEERIRPSMHLFLLRFPELCDHHEIVIRLSVLEYALRLRHDRIPPNPDSYLSLCKHSPERLIKLLRLTENRLPMARANAPVNAAKPSDSTVKDSKLSVSVTLDPLPHNLGCFLLIKMIGKGGMGYVHSAIDLRSTAQIAVKVMRRIDPWSVYRFIEEFTWLSQLSHPNLVKLYDAFAEGDVRYFSMELVEGKTIRDWFQAFMKREKHAPWSQLRRVLAQAASAIDFLHRHSVIHCDIKCSNLMITSRRRAVLLDLGLAIREGNSQPMVGTLQYMAPEVLEGAVPSRQSDWYSFGMLIFEVLTDSYPPIEVDLSAEPGEDKYRMNRDALAKQLANCDEELSGLCLRLLNSDPALRPTGAAVLQTLGRPVEYREINSAAPTIVGRETLLAQLEKAFQESFERPKIALVSGESGIGKSSAVEYWLSQSDLRKQYELVLRLRCFRQDHTPLRLLNSLVQELVQALQRLPESDWRNTLSPHMKEIGDAFPQVLQLVENDLAVTSRPSSATPSFLLRSKGVQRLEEWLVELSQSHRILLVLDDAQWADEESLLLIVGLVCLQPFLGFVVAIDEHGPARIAGLVGNVLPLDARASIDNWLSKIKIEPLTEAASIEILTNLAAEQATDMTPGIASSIARRAEGNPFLLLELYQAYCHYAKRGGISDDQWLQADSHSAVRRRFSMLPIQSENVLQYLAVAGQSIGFHQLQMVSRILPHELQRTLSLLTFQGWVRSESHNLEADVEIAHENFRKVVLQSLPVDRLHRRHFRMARMLSSEVPPPWARMGDHYWKAERFREAATCYLEAARSAFKSSAYADALEFLNRAEFNNDERSAQELTDVLILKADCLAGRGLSKAAAKAYDALGNSAADEPTRLLYNCLAGEQWIRGGEVERGVIRLAHVLSELGITKLQATTRSQSRLRWRTVHLAATIQPQAESTSDGHDTFSALDQSLNRVSVPLIFLHHQLGPDLILRMKKRADTRGSNFDKALAVLHWGVLLSIAGGRWRKPAARWLRKGRQLARLSARPAARGSGELCMFVWHAQKGELSRAVAHANKAIDWFQREPNSLQWEIQLLYWGLVNCHWFAGDLSRCREIVSQQRQIAEDRGGSMSLFLMKVGAAHWSDLATGNVDLARSSIAQVAESISGQTFQSPRFFYWVSQILQCIYENRLREADLILQRAWEHVATSYVFGASYYQWIALCARLCLNLVNIRECNSQSFDSKRDARRCLNRLLRLQEPAFVAHGKAFALVLQATRQTRLPTQDQWQAVINELHRLDHHLMAAALSWHQSLYAPEDLKAELQASAKTFFHDASCQQPEKLMDIILPLPHVPSDF